MVLTGLAVASVPWPPTSLSFGPSVPVGPWHIAHLAAKTWAPCFTVPCPEGRPSPVGDTSMFQARTSSSVAVRPSPYPPPSSADPAVQKHHARPIASVRMPISSDLRINVPYPYIRVHSPPLNGAFVKKESSATHLHELRSAIVD